MAVRRSGRWQRIRSWLGFAGGRDPSPCAADWAPGDMAQNVATSRWVDFWANPAPGPARGDVYRVVEVRLIIDPRSGSYGRFLVFSRFRPRFYDARNFRKVTPRPDPARAADTAFVKLLDGHGLPSPSLADQLKRIFS